MVLAALSAAVWLAGGDPAAVRSRNTWIIARRHPLTEFAAVARERAPPVGVRRSRSSPILGTFTVGSFSGPYLAATNGWGEDKLAVIYFVAGVLTLFGMNAVGRLSDRYNRLRAAPRA